MYNIEFLGITDLVKRWNYTRQGIHQKQKEDEAFPVPICKINNGRTQVFLKEDIVKYEQKHRELTDQDYKNWHQKKWCFSNKQ